jgi:hypothetical protein
MLIMSEVLEPKAPCRVWDINMDCYSSTNKDADTVLVFLNALQ